jgi:hypothetical protein
MYGNGILPESVAQDRNGSEDANPRALVGDDPRRVGLAPIGLACARAEVAEAGG